MSAMARRFTLTLVLQPWAVVYVSLMAGLDGGPLFIDSVARYVRRNGLQVR